MNKKINLAFGILITLLLINLASAADTVTLATPAASGYVRGTYNFSATVDSASEVVNITFYYNSSGATQVAICNDVNASAGETSFSCEASTSSYSDGTFSFYAYAYDDDHSTELSNDESASVVMDNTAPTVTFSIPFYHFETTTPMTVSCSATDATAGVANYTITITKPDSSTATTTDTSAITSHTFAAGDFGMPGSYTINCSVYDSASNTASTQYDLTAKSGTAPKKLPPEKDIIDIVEENKFIVLVAAAALILVVIIIIMASSGSKKRRRRR